ncbi:MAG: ABC transporter ATP-binding protein [Clostridium sp.]
MDIIVLKDINKIYGQGVYKTHALKGVNLEIKKGEMIAIMGPSGSGKSTLLNILGCIDSPTTGEYLLDGVNISKINKNKMAEIRNSKIGFVFQNFNLLYDFNLVDNIALPLIYSKNKKDIKGRCERILTEVGLGEYLKRTPDKISGGQKQRVAIARALVNNPEIILADEPTGALDKQTGIDILNKLIDINKSGKTVIIITHDIDVANMCERVINIVDGCIKEA